MLSHLNKENDVLTAPHAGKVNLKTPGPGKMNTKTPFKIPLNDENGPTAANPKTGKKNIFAGKDASQFVTPVGPRRALAGKTTNVKARNLAPPTEQQTEKKGGLGSSVRPTRTRVSFSEQTKPVLYNEDDVPEIEYMPPPVQDLPYIPIGVEEEDFDLGDLGETLMNGCHRAFLSGLDENGKTRVARETEELYRRIEADLDAETEQLMEEINGTAPIRNPKTKATPLASDRINVAKTRSTTGGTAKNLKEIKRPATATATTRPKSRPTSRASSRPASKGASTIDSRRAASALSKHPTSRSNSSAAVRAPEAKVIPKGHSRSVSTSVVSAKKQFGFARGPPNEPPKGSHARSRSIATATHELASKNSIGYTNGRQVGKKVVDELHVKPQRETALEAIERILAEDEERYSANSLLSSTTMSDYDEEDAVNEIVLDIPSPLVEDEDEEFFIPLPEYN